MKILKTYTIETNRCRLRLPSRDDIPYIYSATRHAGFNDGMRWEPPESEAELEQPYVTSLAAWDDETAYCFTIEERHAQAFIGRIVIRKEKEEGVWNIGFWTHPEQQGKGYMSEAVGPVVDFGFTQLNATSIEACHALWNKASKCVLYRAGMRFIRYIPQGFVKRGEWVEENLLAINRKQWEKNKA